MNGLMRQSRMKRKIDIDAELREILKEILRESESLQYWHDHSASDWFQSPNYCGGFEGSEEEFTFSFFASGGQEYWFQFPLSQVPLALAGEILSFNGRKAR